MDTDGFVALVECMSYEELNELEEIIKHRRRNIENEIIIKDVRELLAAKNSCVWNHWRVNSINPSNVKLDIDLLSKKKYSHNVESEPAQFIDDGIRVTYLPLLVGICAPKHYFEKWKIDELEKWQHDWVEYIGCDYDPNDHDQQFLVNLDWDLECIKYKLDDTYGTATLFVEVYYKVNDMPKEGTKFKCFDSDGSINKWEVRDNELYIENSQDKKYDIYFGPVCDWDKYNIFVVADDYECD